MTNVQNVRQMPVIFWHQICSCQKVQEYYVGVTRNSWISKMFPSCKYPHRLLTVSLANTESVPQCRLAL